MNKKIFGWDLSEAISLLKLIKKSGEGNINKAFDLYAKNNNRKASSVRNFYYAFCNEVKINVELRAYLGNCLDIDFGGDKRRFGKTDERDLLLKILDNTDNLSVRAKCFKIANGDKKTFVRLQNKYQNLLRTNKNMVNDVIEELMLAGKNVRRLDTPTPQNVIAMPLNKNKPLREEEIQALFWGLVRLVKKTAEDETRNMLAKEAEFANTTLQNTLIDIRRKDVLINELRERNKVLVQELKNTKKQLSIQTTKNVSNYLTINDLLKSEKLQELKIFIQKLNPMSKSRDIGEE